MEKQNERILTITQIYHLEILEKNISIPRIDSSCQSITKHNYIKNSFIINGRNNRINC